MKAIKYSLFIIFGLFAILTFLFFPLPFTKGKLKEEIKLINVSKDTILRYERYGKWVKLISENSSEGLGMPFLISVSGEVDAETEIHLKYVGYPDAIGYLYILSKGRVDTVFNGELYENKAELAFLHKQATTGNLKIVFELGKGPGYGDSPSSDEKTRMPDK